MELNIDFPFNPSDLDAECFETPNYDFEVTFELKLYLLIQEIKKEGIIILKKNIDKFPENLLDLINDGEYENRFIFFRDYLVDEREKLKIEFLDIFISGLKNLYVELYKSNISRKEIKLQMALMRRDKLHLTTRITYERET